MNKLGRPHNPNATYQVPKSSAFWFWRRFLKGFYHIWAWRPSCSCDQDHLNKLSFPRPKESPYEFEFNWPSGFRGEDVCNCGRTDDGRTDTGVTGILLAHPSAFGSGELIITLNLYIDGTNIDREEKNFHIFTSHCYNCPHGTRDSVLTCTIFWTSALSCGRGGGGGGGEGGGGGGH